MQFPTPRTVQDFLRILNNVISLHHLKQIQASITINGLHSHLFLIGKLIQISTISSLSYALHIFSHTSPQNLDIVSYNALLKSLCSSSQPYHALQLFEQMLRSISIARMDSFTFAFTLKACARSNSLISTQVLHAVAFKSWNVDHHAYIANTTVHAYASCGDVVSARRCFNLMALKDTIGWNAMISGYVQNGCSNEAIMLFANMLAAGEKPTDVTIISGLSACGISSEICLGRQIHGHATKSVMWTGNNINMGTALLDMYSKCGCIELSRKVFDEMTAKDTGVWNALINGYVLNHQFCVALDLFTAMQDNGFDPDQPTLVSALSACSRLGKLDIGESIHEYVKERYRNYDAALGTSLIEMYAKCGCIEKSKEVFDRTLNKDAMTWTSMIGSLAAHGHVNDALKLFGLMQKAKIRPDSVTFVGVLSACSRAGLVEEGIRYFNSMKDDSINPRIEHYGCMIDMFSRAGRLNEALEFINSMCGKANPVIWRTLLSACRLNSDIELAEVAVNNLRELGSDHCGDYVLISNIYALKGWWDDARRVRKQMQDGRITKKSAFSLIDNRQ